MCRYSSDGEFEEIVSDKLVLMLLEYSDTFTVWPPESLL